jgi:hypothetical protein
LLQRRDWGRDKTYVNINACGSEHVLVVGGLTSTHKISDAVLLQHLQRGTGDEHKMTGFNDGANVDPRGNLHPITVSITTCK